MMRRTGSVAFALVAIAVLALSTPMQPAYASASGTVQSRVINENTGQIVATSNQVSWTAPVSLGLAASFSTTKTGINWKAVIQVVKDVLVGTAKGEGSLLVRLAGAVLLTLAVKFGSTTNLTTYSIDQNGTWEFEVDATITEVSTSPVGGSIVPVDKFGLLAPYIGIASTVIAAAAIATTIYVKRRIKKQ